MNKLKKTSSILRAPIIDKYEHNSNTLRRHKTGGEKIEEFSNVFFVCFFFPVCDIIQK